MKKIIFAAICLLSFRLTAAAYNTYAPNSWDIVKKEAWDYQAVYDLCEKGRAPDYDRNFFNRGSLTRYELASVLKNILEAEKKGAAFTEEEKKKLIRLKKEYARELDALGYRDEKGKNPLLKSKVMPEFAGQKAKKTMPVSILAQNGI